MRIAQSKVSTLYSRGYHTEQDGAKTWFFFEEPLNP